MTKKLKINPHCQIRQVGDLYCLTDLYRFMDMRNERSAPQNWSASRAGLSLTKKGFFRKTYWGSVVQLIDYAESLTPGIAKEVRSALGMPKVMQGVFEEMGGVQFDVGDRLAKVVASYRPAARAANVADQIAQVKREVARIKPAARGTPTRTRGHRSSSRGDDMVMQAVLMQSVLDDTPSRSSHSSSHHSHHSSHDSGSYDSGSSDSGSSGCD